MVDLFQQFIDEQRKKTDLVYQSMFSAAAGGSGPGNSPGGNAPPKPSYGGPGPGNAPPPPKNNPPPKQSPGPGPGNAPAPPKNNPPSSGGGPKQQPPNNAPAPKPERDWSGIQNRIASKQAPPLTWEPFERPSLRESRAFEMPAPFPVANVAMPNALTMTQQRPVRLAATGGIDTVGGGGGTGPALRDIYQAKVEQGDGTYSIYFDNETGSEIVVADNSPEAAQYTDNDRYELANDGMTEEDVKIYGLWSDDLLTEDIPAKATPTPFTGTIGSQADYDMALSAGLLPQPAEAPFAPPKPRSVSPKPVKPRGPMPTQMPATRPVPLPDITANLPPSSNPQPSGPGQSLAVYNWTYAQNMKKDPTPTWTLYYDKNTDVYFAANSNSPYYQQLEDGAWTGLTNIIPIQTNLNQYQVDEYARNGKFNPGQPGNNPEKLKMPTMPGIIGTGYTPPADIIDDPNATYSVYISYENGTEVMVKDGTPEAEQLEANAGRGKPFSMWRSGLSSDEAESYMMPWNPPTVFATDHDYVPGSGVIGDSINFVLGKPTNEWKGQQAEVVIKHWNDPESLSEVEKVVLGMIISQSEIEDIDGPGLGLTAISPVDFGEWMLGHRAETEAAYAEGGYQAVWELYQADANLLQRILHDIVNDPWLFAPIVAAPLKGVKGASIGAKFIRGAGRAIDITERAGGLFLDDVIRVGGGAIKARIPLSNSTERGLRFGGARDTSRRLVNDSGVEIIPVVQTPPAGPQIPTKSTAGNTSPVDVDPVVPDTTTVTPVTPENNLLIREALLEDRADVMESMASLEKEFLSNPNPTQAERDAFYQELQRHSDYLKKVDEAISKTPIPSGPVTPTKSTAGNTSPVDVQPVLPSTVTFMPVDPVTPEGIQGWIDANAPAIKRLRAAGATDAEIDAAASWELRRATPSRPVEPIQEGDELVNSRGQRIEAGDLNYDGKSFAGIRTATGNLDVSDVPPRFHPYLRDLADANDAKSVQFFIDDAISTREFQQQVNRTFGPKGIANPASAATTGEYVTDFYVQYAAINPNAVLPAFTPSTAASLGPNYRNFERAIHQPWDETVGSRGILARNNVILDTIPAGDPTSRQLIALDNYVRMVDQYRVWHPTAVYDADFAAAVGRRDAIAKYFTDRGLAYGDNVRKGGGGQTAPSAGAAAAPPPTNVRSPGGATAAAPPSARPPRAAAATPPVVHPYGDVAGYPIVPGTSTGPNAPTIVRIDADTTVALTAIEKANVPKVALDRFPGDTTPSWTESMVQDAKLPNPQRHYAPTREQALDLAVQDAQGQGLVGDFFGRPTNRQTSEALDVESAAKQNVTIVKGMPPSGQTRSNLPNGVKIIHDGSIDIGGTNAPVWSVTTNDGSATIVRDLDGEYRVMPNDVADEDILADMENVPSFKKHTDALVEAQMQARYGTSNQPKSPGSMDAEPESAIWPNEPKNPQEYRDILQKQRNETGGGGELSAQELDMAQRRAGAERGRSRNLWKDAKASNSKAEGFGKFRDYYTAKYGARSSTVYKAKSAHGSLKAGRDVYPKTTSGNGWKLADSEIQRFFQDWDDVRGPDWARSVDDPLAAANTAHAAATSRAARPQPTNTAFTPLTRTSGLDDRSVWSLSQASQQRRWSQEQAGRITTIISRMKGAQDQKILDSPDLATAGGKQVLDRVQELDEVLEAITRNQALVNDPKNKGRKLSGASNRLRDLKARQSQLENQLWISERVTAKMVPNTTLFTEIATLTPSQKKYAAALRRTKTVQPVFHVSSSMPSEHGLTLDGHGVMRFRDTIMGVGDLEVMTRDVMPGGDTFVERWNKYIDLEFAKTKGTGWMPNVMEKARIRALGDYDAFLSKAYPTGKPPVGLRTLTKVTDAVRRMVLYSWASAMRIINVQAFGNAFITTMGGYGKQYAREALDPRMLVRAFRLQREASGVTGTLLTDMGDGYMLSFERDLIQGGAAATDVMIDRISRDLEGGGASLTNRAPGKQAPIPIRALGGDQVVADVANSFDSINRSAVGHGAWTRRLKQDVPEFTEEARVRLGDAGFSQWEINNILTDLWAKHSPRTLKMADVRQFMRGYLDGDIADRLGRDWQSLVNKRREFSLGEVARVTFGGTGRTKLDDALSPFLMFHYFQSRQGMFMVRQALRHPALMNAYLNWQDQMEQYAERNKETLPSWAQGAIKLASIMGVNVFWHPFALLQVGALFNGPSDDWDSQEDKTRIQEWLDADIPIVGGKVQDWAFFNPVITSLFNLTGYTGDDRDFDPLFLAQEGQIAAYLINVGKDKGWVSQDFINDGLVGNPAINAGNFLRGKVTENFKLPGANVVEWTNESEAEQRDFNAILVRIAEEELDLDPDDPDDAAIILDHAQDPDSAIYQQAMDEYLKAELVSIGVKQAPFFSAMRPMTRLADSEGNDLINSQTGQGQMTLRNITDADAANLKNQSNQFYELGDPYDPLIDDLRDDLVYGEMTDSVTLGGVTYTPEQINGWDVETRKDFANAFLEDNNLYEGWQEYKEEQSVFLADPENTEFAQQKTWSTAVRDYDGGVEQYWEDLAEGNPNAKRYLDGLDPSLTDDERERALTNQRAFMAVKGVHPYYNAPTPLDTNDFDPVDIANGPAKPQENEVYVAPSTEEFWTQYETFQKYSSEADQVMNQIMTEWGMDPSIPLNGYTYGTREDLKDEYLNRTGFYFPEPKDEVLKYAKWVEKQPDGADTSPEAYIVWKDEQYIVSMPDYFNEDIANGTPDNPTVDPIDFINRTRTLDPGYRWEDQKWWNNP